MKAIRYHWKALIRNKVSMMILLGLFLLTLIPPYYCSLFSGTEAPVADVYRSSTGAFFYAFLLFLFLGFFISRLTVEAGLKEVFCRSELTHYTLSGLAFSLLLSVALTVLILIPNLIACLLLSAGLFIPKNPVLSLSEITDNTELRHFFIRIAVLIILMLAADFAAVRRIRYRAA